MKILVLLLLALPGISEAALELKGVPESGAVNFLAIGRPSMLKIHGKAPGPTGSFRVDGDKLSGSAEFEIAQLDTGINLRNEHMKEKYLEIKDHPKALLSLTDTPVDKEFENTLSNSGERPFKGKLQLHGQEKEVSGKYRAKDGIVKAEFQIKLTDFGIEIPSYLGIKVAETVDVSVDLALKKE